MARKVVIGFLLLAAAAVVALFAFAERVEVPYERGFVGAARNNPLLALERTCAALGANVREWPDELEEPAPFDVVLILGSGSELGATRVERLLKWVAEGNRAVVLLPSDGPYRRMLEAEAEAGETRDPLLAALGVELQLWHSPELDEQPFTFTLPRGGSFELAMRAELNLYSDGEQVQAYAPEDEDQSTLAMQVEHGRGRVVLFAESDWLGNEHIGDHDHAALAWAILKPKSPNATLWVVRNSPVPGLLAWLTGRGWPTTAAGLALLVLVLWRVTRRFGPLLPELPRDRRDFGEHLDAVGRLHWRLGATDDLLAPLRAELRKQAARTRAEWSALDDAQLADALAGASGRPAPEVRAALTARVITTPQEFTRTVQCLRALQEAL
jgi:hypothetical protein